jgi:hypothetical protein
VAGLDETARALHYRDKVAIIARGLLASTGEVPPAGDMLLTIIALATSWHVLPELHRMIPGASRRAIFGSADSATS